jgi:hypothetical protein
VLITYQLAENQPSINEFFVILQMEGWTLYWIYLYCLEQADSLSKLDVNKKLG